MKREEHGLSKHPLYRLWCAMKTRCTNPNYHRYDRYGGRGISICPEWASSFTAFLRDMEDSYAPGLSLDRIDNDGNYEPGNCRWATQHQQTYNRCNARYVETKTGRRRMMDYAKELGVSRSAMNCRAVRAEKTGKLL